jgi:two-component sensor histidine kinase
VLTLHPERFYDWLVEANCVLPEVLLVPLYIRGNAPLGTLWVVSEQEGHFRRRHARILSELAAFVGVAVRLRRTEENLRAELNQQALIANEMSHRVRNVFAVADGLIRMGGKLAVSKEELIQSLSARLHALAKAHALIGRNPNDGAKLKGNLQELLSQVVMPFQGHIATEHSRVEFNGPNLACGDHAITSLALMLHELATNSHKYGALSSAEGRVRIRWVKEEGDLSLFWTESGGPAVEAPPERSGFGSTLLESMVKQLGGSIEYHWPPQGVAIAVRLSLQRLQL